MAWNEEREKPPGYLALVRRPAVVNFASRSVAAGGEFGRSASGGRTGELDFGRCAMSEGRRQILEMLAAGKITADEAERLLVAVEVGGGAVAGKGEDAGPKRRAKYLRVQVEGDESMTGLKGGPTTVNVRVPMQLLRAGVRLAGLIPQRAHDQLDQALSSHGVPLTLSQIKPENLEELIDHLEDLKVDVDGKNGNTTKVRVFCE